MGSELSWSAGVGFLWNRLQDSVGVKRGEVGLNQVLLFLVENYPDLVTQVCLAPSVDRVAEQAQKALAAGDGGARLTLEALSSPASRWASERGKDRLYERDLIAAVLELAGLPVRPMAGPAVGPTTSPAVVPGPPAVAAKPSLDTAPPSPRTAEAQPAPDLPWRPKAAAPNLETLGRDLTAQAAAGELGPVVGREREIELVIETLCRPSKPNPLLLGPAGVGKTAIVEALAQRVVEGRVPPPLRDARIFALQTADLVQGMGVVGELEKRMRAVVEEAQQRGVIVFLDEIHTVVGAGAGGRSGNDLANILKPALSRGKMLCVGATTDGEYARYLSTDSAFERRFGVVKVQELDPQATREVLAARAAALARKTSVQAEPDALDAIIALSDRYLRHRRFPDKAIDILDQAVARAVVLGRTGLDANLVREVVTRVVGLPVTGEERDRRLALLPGAIVERAGLRRDDAERIARRLRVTMANLDLRPGRPNAVIALPGLGRAARVAQVLAECLLGDGARVVEEDFSSYTHPADVSRLIGAAPGYVGYDEALRLHLALRQQPWSVVLLRAVDCAHPTVQAVLGKALSEGVLRDAHGEDTSWADTICVLGLCAGGFAPSHTLGFITGGRSPADRVAGPDLEPSLAACVDITCAPPEEGGAPPPTWVRTQLLEPLERRWLHETGCRLEWSDGFESWVAARAAELGLEAGGLERWFEEQVVGTVVAAAGAHPGARALHVAPGSAGEVVVAAEEDMTGVEGIEPQLAPADRE